MSDGQVDSQDCFDSVIDSWLAPMEALFFKASGPSALFATAASAVRTHQQQTAIISGLHTLHYTISSGACTHLHSNWLIISEQD